MTVALNLNRRKFSVCSQKNVRIRKEVREDNIEERSYNERRRELVAFERGDYMSGHH